MAVQGFNWHWLLALFIFLIILDFTVAQRKKFQDRPLNAESEYDELEAYLKDVSLSEDQEKPLADEPAHVTKSPATNAKHHHRHRNRNRAARHSRLETSVSSVEESTYFKHRTKPFSVHEQRLFDWDDGTDEVTTDHIPTTTDTVRSRPDKYKNRNNRRKMTHPRNQDQLRNVSGPSTRRSVDSSQLRTRKSTHTALEQSGYQSVTYPPRSGFRWSQTSREHGSSRHSESTYRHRSETESSHHASYPRRQETPTTERPDPYAHHQTRQRQRADDRRYGSEEYYQPGQHSRPSSHSQSGHRTHSHAQQYTPRYPDSRYPPATPRYPYPNYEQTTSGTIWGNRSVEGGRFFDKDYDDTYSPIHTSIRQPPPQQPSAPGLDIDTVLDREAIYGQYSPGDLQDLGISIDDLPRRNFSIEDTMHPFALLYRPGGSIAQICELRSCYPATGNLLIGREDRLTTTSTCGVDRKERYCIVSHLEERKKCFICDSRPTAHVASQSHHASNIVSRFGPRKKTWWQSRNGEEEVTIQLDLEAEFHFTHLIITFKTFRPAAMLIERSYDFGRTWHVYRYFAYDCAESFPGIPLGPPRRITDVVCTTRYSGVAPSTEGEVIFRVLPPNLPIDDPYSSEVQKLLKMTNLRVNFTKLHTLGDNLLDQRREIKEKYYYAIYDMIVRGSCSCYGHANRCVPINPSPTYPPDMVHGKCECTHHTKGQNCEECEDFYNDLPWKPAYDKNINACQRCQCHNHATSCHFDLAVFTASGNISGGVCHDCEHNTMGNNCQYCKQFYFRDPHRDIGDPYVCQACDCDPRGSLDDGMCDPLTDYENSLEAGRCTCKLNVEGKRCDYCKNGFWNFDASNPHGCESCTCHHLGTVENQGCNQYNGECTCKRYVTGQKCDQCMPEHWGLSEDRDGCRPCDCDPGGAYDNNCDVISGQCRCQAHVTGRRCDQPDQGFFAIAMDYLTYEAELARGSENTQVVIREPYADRDTLWTGTGFTRVFEGSTLEFDINNVPRTMDYDIVIRYEPQAPRTWEYVQVIVERPGPIDPNDKCANTIPQDDRKQANLPSGGRNSVVFPPACLEQGRSYKLKIDFRRYDTQVDTPTASVLIDSVALIPRIDSIPFFQGTVNNEYRRQEFERLRCAQMYYGVARSQIHETCKKYLWSIGVYVHGGALECNCDPTGAVSSLCDTLGGYCSCRPNIVGRQCNRCAPGTYGFSPNGCRACDCNSIGSLDNFCEAQTGQCKCRQNTYGRQCNECQPGFWNYPTCQRCECNGHADTCDSRNGHCLECRDFTTGIYCDRCETSFYGDPRIGINIPCRSCPCPGTVESGHSYASTCSLDPRTQTVVCNCEEGYSGDRCDYCANNYYGNPDTPGGKCHKCSCNNNIDVLRPGNCDSRTGECKQCLFSTEGFHCDQCQPGFYGDAIQQLCRECVCNFLGTNSSRGHCDRVSGQCHCLPSVVGLSCDRCEDNYWKIASGEGCSRCSCDPLGSLSQQCNEYDGQCLCKEGFGGRQCNECQANYWGDPNIECYPCNCNREGSATMQCHRNNGSCVCLPGMGAKLCDQCARGYTGRAPYCEPCGECFDNWDIIIQELKEETLRLIALANTVNSTGATGGYPEQFKEMEEKLARVNEILENTNITNVDIGNLQGLIDDLNHQLRTHRDQKKGIDDEVDETLQRVIDAQLQLSELKEQKKGVQKKTKDLKDKARLLQEADVDGALNITREAHLRSQKAQAKVDYTTDILGRSAQERKRTNNLIEQGMSYFNRTYTDNEATLGGIDGEIDALEREMPALNNKVCDGFGDPCDMQCGGAGCDKCGGLSCSNGALNKANEAYSFASEADKRLRELESNATALQINLIEAKKDADQAKEEAQIAYDKALAAKNKSDEIRDAVEEILDRIDNFLNMDGATPAEIKFLAEQVMSKSISLDPERIKDLAKQINDTIASLTDIDKILANTEGDLARAKRLKERADRAKKQAEGVLEMAQEVVKMLTDAEDAQKKAKEAIDKANKDIGSADLDLTQIASETAAAQGIANKSIDDIEQLQIRLENLKRKYVENERNVQKALNEAKVADNHAKAAEMNADDLEGKYNHVLKLLDDKVISKGDSRDKAEKLRDRANELAHNITGKMRELEDMENQFEMDERRLRDLSEELDLLNGQMSGYLESIEKRAAFYRDCQT